MSINFSPYFNNVLDYIGIPLLSADGRKVVVSRVGNDFVIEVEGEKPYRTDDNLSASYRLNQLECDKKGDA